MQLLCTHAWPHLELELQVQEGGVLPHGAARVAAPTMAQEADAQPWAEQGVDGLSYGGINAAPDTSERGGISDEVGFVVEEGDAGHKGFSEKHGDRTAPLRAASQILHISCLYDGRKALQDFASESTSAVRTGQCTGVAGAVCRGGHQHEKVLPSITGLRL